MFAASLVYDTKAAFRMGASELEFGMA